MKKQIFLRMGWLVLAGGMVVQAHAAAVTPCTGTAGPAVAALATATDGSVFLREAMKFKCSNNVFLSADQDSAKAWTASASRKGRYYWGGNTDGGSASKLGNSEVTPGTDPSLSGPLDIAKTVGTSS